MISPTRVATIVIGAMLSACIFSTSLDPALAGPIATSSDAAAGTAAAVAAPETREFATQPRGRAYLFRGALGPIFSRGMDRLTRRLEQAGIKADVYEFTICPLVAAQAIRDYRDDPAPITLIGHSMGGLCALKFAEMLQDEGLPVNLVVTIDPAHVSPTVPLNVERYINIFLSNSVLGGGDVVAKRGYQGHYASFDLSEHDEITHINIDKMDSIHEQLVTAIVQLATTPASLCRSPRRSSRAVGQWHAAVGPFGRYVADACGTSPCAAVVADPDQSAVRQCNADGWPARDLSAPSRTVRRDFRAVAAEGGNPQRVETALEPFPFRRIETGL
jgi:pimeloyl-ACP methyl ester carboxylesterase